MTKRRRRSRMPRAPEEEAPPPKETPLAPLPPGKVLLLALGFSVWTGLVEEIPVFIAPMGHVVVRLSGDFIWMTPLGDFVFFSLAGLVLLVLSRFWPWVAGRPMVLAVFSFLAVLALGLVPERIHPLAVTVLALGVGYQVKGRTRPTQGSGRFLKLVTAFGVLIILGMTVRKEWQDWQEKSEWTSSLRTAHTGAPNILFIILDTVRGASLSFLPELADASKWDSAETPFLDSLATESKVFSRAMAPAPWTLPSHASMFTGKWPVQHGGGGGVSVRWMGALGPEYPTVAEVLRRRGYYTAGFVGNLVFTTSETGLSRGFITYEDYTISLGQILVSCSLGRRFAQNRTWRKIVGYHDALNRKKAGKVADQFLRWEARHTGAPYFAFLNFFDAHEPYLPSDSVKRGMPSGSRWDDITHFVGLLTGVTGWRTDKWEMDPAEQSGHAAAYGEAVGRVDLELDRMLRELERRGGLENTVLIISSDHGEQLGEHRLYNHNNSLYLPLLHVPLLIHDPRDDSRPQRIPDVVSLRNVGATILDLAGLDPNMGGMEGQTLSRFWQRTPGADSPSPPQADTVFATLDRGTVDRPWYPSGLGPSMYSLTDSVHHYILNGDGTEELFDHTEDAGELNNLAGSPEAQYELAEFRTMLRSVVGDLPVIPTSSPPAPSDTHPPPG